MRIQFITFPGCPNASAARKALERALTAAGILDRIEDVNTFAADTPENLRGWGSPTVLLNGEDVGGQAVPSGPSCRLYTGDRGKVLAAPSEALLSAALRRATGALPLVPVRRCVRNGSRRAR